MHTCAYIDYKSSATSPVISAILDGVWFKGDVNNPSVVILAGDLDVKFENAVDTKEKITIRFGSSYDGHNIVLDDKNVAQSGKLFIQYHAKKKEYDLANLNEEEVILLNVLGLFTATAKT